MKHKGFTLAELLVTIAVSGIILASILALVVSIVSFNQIRNDRMIINDELTLVETRITDWFSEKDTNAYKEPIAESVKLSLLDAQDTAYTASFDATNGTLTLDGKTYTTMFINGIVFAQSEDNKNLVKCTVSYTTENNTQGTYAFMLLKRSMNA